MSLFGPVGRFIDRRVRAVTRTVKKVPVVGSVVKAGEGALKGPIGRTMNRIVSNPIISTAFGPIAVPMHMAYATTTGGLKGAEAAAKQELRNPVRRAVVSALGAVFPPAAPAAVALNAANIALDAAEKGRPEDMVKAAAQIGAAYAGASSDPHLAEVANVLNKAKSLRATAQRAAGAVSFPNLHELNAGWLGSTRANDVLEAIHPEAHAALQPHSVLDAVNVLRKVVGLGPGQKIPDVHVQQAVATAANAIGLGLSHPHIPFFVDLAKAAHAALVPVATSSKPAAKNILQALEEGIMAHTTKRVAELNALVVAYDAKHPDAVAKVQALKTAHAHGDHSATALYDDLRRRTAALRKAREYTVDTKGFTRHGGPGHPAAQPHGSPVAVHKTLPPKPGLHPPAHAAH